MEQALNELTGVNAHIEKLDKTVQEQYGFLKGYIDENNNMMQNILQKIKDKLSGKPDFAYFDVFKQSVDEKILGKWSSKIDKMEVK